MVPSTAPRLYMIDIHSTVAPTYCLHTTSAIFFTKTKRAVFLTWAVGRRTSDV